MGYNRPNILLITTDQQRFDTINAAGFSHMKTPNLDRLVKEGCLFQNAYSPNPVCIPARHNIVSGLSAKHHGFDDNYFDNSIQMPSDLPTFPELLTNSGYGSIGIGKMHFQPCRRHNGFDRMLTMEEIPEHLEDDDYALYLHNQGYEHLRSFHGVRHLLYMLPQQSFLPIEHHGTTWVADRTIEAMKGYTGDRPFLIWSSFIEPHPPFDVPEEWAHTYDDVEIPEGAVSETPLSSLAEENKHIADYPTKEVADRAKRLYYSAISFVDDQIGRILDYLEESGRLNDTLIVFTSDHGEMMGDFETYQKFLPYDGSSKIPFVVRYPKLVEPGSVDDRFVDLNDLLPTFLDVAGVEYPANHKLPGESIFVEDGFKNRGLQYVEHNKGNKRWVSLRDHHYKYNYYYGGGCEELFDMIADPQETTNLLHGPVSEEAESARVSLREKLVRYEKAYGLEGYVVNDDFVEMEPYVAVPYRETNFPKHVESLTKEKKEILGAMEDEIQLAIKNESVVNLEELDLETFQRFGGFSADQVKALLKN